MWNSYNTLDWGNYPPASLFVRYPPPPPLSCMTTRFLGGIPIIAALSMLYNSSIFKSPPTLWWWRLIVFAESARRCHLFLLSLENPYSDYFQIFAVCILALGNLPGKIFFCVLQFLQQNPRWPTKSYVIFFFFFFIFFNKIQDGCQNPMSLSRAWTASWICFMFGLK